MSTSSHTQVVSLKVTLQSRFLSRCQDMLPTSVLVSLFCVVAVHSFKISSKIDTVFEPGHFRSSPQLQVHQKELDPPYADHEIYEAIFAGIKQPIAIDCTNPGVICKIPLTVVNKEDELQKPAKNIQEVPIIKGAILPDDDKNLEGREDSEENIGKIATDVTVPIFKGTFDVESIAADEKDIEDIWILEKNTINKKYKIPVKVVPSSNHHDHLAPVYPPHHDFHDHFNGQFDRHGSGGWTPWMRAYPAVYNYASNHPCQPPVYHYPPPCSSGFAPTKKPTINIDDKVDKEND